VIALRLDGLFLRLDLWRRLLGGLRVALLGCGLRAVRRGAVVVNGSDSLRPRICCAERTREREREN
jgi:hypothetical protein